MLNCARASAAANIPVKCVFVLSPFLLLCMPGLNVVLRPFGLRFQLLSHRQPSSDVLLMMLLFVLYQSWSG